MTPYFSYKNYSEYFLVKGENFSIESNLKSDGNFTISFCGRIKISKTLKFHVINEDFQKSLEVMIQSIAMRYEEILNYRDSKNIEMIYLDKYIYSHLGRYLQ